MGRRIAILAALLAVLAFAVYANIPHGPVIANLADIVNREEQWTGTRVQVTGELISFGTYGVIQDPHQDRIGIRSLAPWRSLVGHQVVAVGTVAFDPHFGLYLANPQLRAARGSPH